MKKNPKRIAMALISAAVGLTLTGCFSYSREVTRTETPAAVEVPPATVVTEPATVVTEPTTTSSTTTTTNDDGVVQRQRTTTYSYP